MLTVYIKRLIRGVEAEAQDQGENTVQDEDGSSVLNVVCANYDAVLLADNE